MLNTLSVIKPPSKLLLTVILGMLFIHCKAQTKQDSILSMRIREINQDDIQMLVKVGYIKKIDAIMLGAYIVDKIQKDTIIKNWTVKQTLDSAKDKANQMAIKENNYGKDSVFLRSPDGAKILLGMGRLSLEKLVARESENLPGKYDGDYNLFVSTSEGITKIGKLIAENNQGWLVGNVLFIERDNKMINKLRIGDIFEIAKRIAISPEFAPFIKSMNHTN